VARFFNGSGQFAQITRTTRIEPALPIAVAMWMRPGVQSAFHYFLSKIALAGDHSAYAIGTSSGGALRFYVSTGVGQGQLVAAVQTIGSAPFDSKWHHVLGTYDGTTVLLYLDGAQVGSAANTAPIDYALGTGGNHDLFLGSFDATQLYTNGDYAEVAVWSAIPSADQRAALAAGVPASRVRPDALVGYWPLYGASTTEADLSGGANSATITGATPSGLTAPMGPYAPAPLWAPAVAAAAGSGITAVGIPSAEAWGTAKVGAGGVLPAGIASAESWGTATIGAGSITAAGIPSAEAWGTALIGSSGVGWSGIAPAEAWGTPLLGAGSVQPAGIPSAEAWGVPTITVGARLGWVGIPSAEAWGRPIVGDLIPPVRGTATVIDVFRPVELSADGEQVTVGTVARATPHKVGRGLATVRVRTPVQT
jgi:hypothetical protein